MLSLFKLLGYISFLLVLILIVALVPVLFPLLALILWALKG